MTPRHPLSSALDRVDAWLEAPELVLLAATESYWRDLRIMLACGRVARGRVHDARAAALCRQHGVRELWAADRDFSRFPDLTVRDPLTDAKRR